MTEAVFAAEPSRLLIAAAAGIVLLLLLIIKFKIHPILSLLISALFIGLGAGMPVPTLVSTVEKGAGETLQGIALGITGLVVGAGSVLVANMLNVDLGVMIAVGVPVGILSLIFAGILWSKFIGSRINTGISTCSISDRSTDSCIGRCSSRSHDNGGRNYGSDAWSCRIISCLSGGNGLCDCDQPVCIGVRQMIVKVILGTMQNARKLVSIVNIKS